MKIQKIFISILLMGVLVVNALFFSISNESKLQLSSLINIASAQSENGNGGGVTIPCNSYWLEFYSNLTACTEGGTTAGGTPYYSGVEYGTSACNNGNSGGCTVGSFHYVYSCDGTKVGSDGRTYRNCPI